MTNSETFQWNYFKICKKVCVMRRDTYREDIPFVIIVFKQIDFENLVAGGANFSFL